MHNHICTYHEYVPVYAHTTSCYGFSNENILLSTSRLTSLMDETEQKFVPVNLYLCQLKLWSGFLLPVNCEDLSTLQYQKYMFYMQTHTV